MNITEESTYEFGLILPDKYEKDIYLFNQSVPTVDEGLNGTVPEKIRRFNNAASHLVRSILTVKQACILRSRLWSKYVVNALACRKARAFYSQKINSEIGILVSEVVEFA